MRRACPYLRRMRSIAWLAIVAFGLVAVPVSAQPSLNAVTAIAAAANAKTGAAAPAASQKPPAGDLQNLVGILQNDQQRTQLINELQALIAAQKGAAPATSPAKSAAPAIESEVPGVVEGLAAKFGDIAKETLDIIGIARAAPSAVRWFEAQAASPTAQTAWLDALTRLAIVFVAATLVAIAAGRLLRPLRARIVARHSEQFLRWLAQFVIMLVLAWVPIAVFVAVATLVLAALAPAWPARPIAAIAIAAILRSQALLAAAWVVLLSPVYPYFLRLSEESRTYVYIWTRRFVCWAVYGFATAQLVTMLGAHAAVEDLILRLTTIVVAGLAIVVVLQNHAAVSDLLRSGPEAARSTGVFNTIRSGLADIWHVLAILYILGSFGSYLVDLHGGVGFVLRATVASLAVLIGAAFATRLVHILNRRGFELTGDWRRRFPGLPNRANRYLPALVFGISTVIYTVAVLLLLQAWGVDVFGWLEQQPVRETLGSLISIAFVVVIAVIVWELVNAAVERALTGGGPVRQAQVSARLRTLLPLARSTILIAIITMAGIIVLSQLGVNIGPLLAGAGIIGIAIGLGSQQLVRDVINGLFILIENTVAIGDFVDIGGGHAGTVEELTIRSMRLRDGAGAVHTVPFSSVTMIVNTNRGIGNAGVSVNLALGEDTDGAARILAEIASAMRQEPEFKRHMLSDLQYWGVDKVEGQSVTLVGQIVCTDAGRWPVQREFNRRVMRRFQSEGIALALPAQTVFVREQEGVAEARAGDPSQVTRFRAPRDRG
jgi:moderate conductance mechanosensitive channel